MEVLSCSTKAFDWGEKFLRCRQMESLREYQLISQGERRIQQFTRQADGVWRLTETHGAGVVTLETPVRLTLNEPR